MRDIRIGKNVIEALTSGMYEDARFIYREYIQNAADSIDKAVEKGILKEIHEGSIHVTIDKTERKITIEDNGTGIRSDQVPSFLGNIALSEKDGTREKGFRGIGRLGGLGYCDRLVYETSFPGETIKSIMTWDAKDLRKKIDDPKLDLDAASVINSIIKLDYNSEAENEHYFKVTLESVKNDDLLDKEGIEDYLSMVAPIPFANSFIFKSKICSGLQKEGLDIDEYRIFLNTDQLFKAYATAIYKGTETNKSRIDELFDVEFIDIRSGDESIAWGWYGLSKFESQMPKKSNPARGIRLRKHNIQIGSEDTLIRLHKEQRGNFYFFGEIHCLHPKLIPNARRDYFKDNELLKVFEEKLVALFHTKFYKLYHIANDTKNACRKIVRPTEIETKLKEKSKNGFSNKEEKEKFEKEFIEAVETANENKIVLEKIEFRTKNDPVLSKVYEKIVDNFDMRNENRDIKPGTNTKTIFRTNKLSKLNKSEQKFLSKVFTVIDTVLTPDLAENLKQKIEDEFK
ncbi:MAG: ATP-binding protein [Candidatus Aminicenantes bacterium]|nr:ATP-binding protein [Candidatus Aminicenantes bacterium]